MDLTRSLRYFSAPGFLKYDTTEGVLRSPAGTRLVVMNDDFLRGFLAALEYETGSSAPAVLKKCGRFYGERLARRFDRELTAHLGVALRDCAMFEFQALLGDMWATFGMGCIEVNWAVGSKGLLPIKLNELPFHTVNLKGRTRPDLIEGIIEGVFSAFISEPVSCVTTGVENDQATFILCAEGELDAIERMLASGTSHQRIVEMRSEG